MQPVLKPWLLARQSGVLAHISSLPSKYGIGNVGASARQFVDFMVEAGFSAWQVCPVGPTGYGDSPYQSFSAFAGNPYFIDLDELIRVGLLTDQDVSPLKRLPSDRVDYGELYRIFWDIVEMAHERFLDRPIILADAEDLDGFRDRASSWLGPYATFMALKRRFFHVSWTEWPSDFRRGYDGIEKLLTADDRRERSRQEFYQYVFFSQWARLKKHANERGIQMIGDMPIYVALDSVDAWANRSIFRIDELGGLNGIAGVPPDYFSTTGQRWGNPLYDWDELERTEYAWWIERVRASQERFDIVRLDHFRGFYDFWVVPTDAPDASIGHWEAGPGIGLFEAIERSIPDAKLIAEDLGYINRGVYELRKQAGLPGMKIVQFGFGHDDNNVNLPHFFTHDQVVYTGTHDNDTTQGWLNNLEGIVRQQVFDYFDLHDEPFASKLVQAALASVARLVITPLQDILELPSSCRMNSPGTSMGNWQWRFSAPQLDRLRETIAPLYQDLHRKYHRIEDRVQRDFSAPPIESAESGSVARESQLKAI